MIRRKVVELPSGMLGILDKKNNLLWLFYHVTDVWAWTHEPLHHSFFFFREKNTPNTQVWLSILREPWWDYYYFLLTLALDRKKLQPVAGLVQSPEGLLEARQSQTTTLHHLPIHTAHPSCQSNPGHAHISHMKLLERLRGCVFRPVWKESNRDELWPWRGDNN